MAGFINVPNWASFENQGADIAVANLDNDQRQDLIVLRVDSPAGKNQGFYQVGKNLDGAGAVTGGWGNWIEIPDWFPFENQGAGIAIADLDQTGRPDLVVFMIDNPLNKNQGYYKIGKNLDANGNVTGGWSNWIEIPDWRFFENQYGSITIADLDKDGKPELIVFVIDNPANLNAGFYRIGKGLDPNGNITGGWTDWIAVPEWFSWENQGAGVAIADTQKKGVLDLVLFQIDNAIGQNQAFYKVGKNINANGVISDDWSTWLGVPNWFSWENQGGGIAVTTLGGKLKMLTLMVDNPPNQNAGLYEVVELEHDPIAEGQWELLPFNSGVLAVHAALLHTGKVLFFAGSGSSAVRFNSNDFGDVNKGIFTSVVWDLNAAPGQNFFHPKTILDDGGRPFDFFCGGDAFLPDGRLLSAGGTVGYNPFRGRADATVFDPQTQQWTFVKKMAHGRWYPTLSNLGDGRVLATTGLNEAGNDHNQALEFYSAQTNTWQQNHFAQGFPGLPLYAHLFLLENGKFFFSGGRMDDPLQVEPCIFDLTKNPVPTQPVPDLLDPVLRNQSASVLLPPAQDQRVMVIGGGPVGKEDKTDATDKVSVVNLKAANPQYMAVAPMNLPRMHLNAILLPDHTVFVTGGSLKQEDEPLSRLQSELYDPATNTWHLMATAKVPRLYHSTALLLPDGRVVAAGGNPEGGKSVTWEPPDPEEEMRLEIFSPPYLFKGARPVINAVPERWQYGQTIAIQSAQAGDIRWANLIKNGVTTHSFDSGQRLVDLDILSQGNGVIQASITTNPNLAPPGWYMLFIVNNQGVPSIAKWINLA
jgi:Domain of unknown function (DUF1929)/FG-GAP-like repeat